MPVSLYHRYVEFRPFVAGMFNAKSLCGRILNRALHHQHARIYNYSRTTVYGSFPSPCLAMTLQFLNLVHYARGGRIYTYVITLDGQWRFTETGKEYGIDLLSKHTMHSDVNIYIAYSGEFFIRRLKTPYKPALDQETHPLADINDHSHDDNDAPDSTPLNSHTDPAYYALVIDNDSGTYRPSAALLPDLKAFMQRNLPGIKIITLNCMGDAARMDQMKGQQRQRKKSQGKRRVYLQDDGSSLSSSDEDELAQRAASAEKELEPEPEPELELGNPEGEAEEKGKGKEIQALAGEA